MIKRIADLEFLMLVLIGLASGGMLYQSFFYPPTPASFPRFVSGITFLLFLVLFMGRLSGRLATAPVKGGGASGPTWWAVSLVLSGYGA